MFPPSLFRRLLWLPRTKRKASRQGPPEFPVLKLRWTRNRRKNMKRIALAVLFCTFVGTSLSLAAQEKVKTEEKSESKRDLTPLRVQVVISEFDGEKKISSLPYTILFNA